MKQFSEMGITAKRSFVGKSIYPEDILEKEIIVEFYETRPSKKNDGSDCLYLQIKVDNVQHLLFSSSKFLINTLNQLKDDDFPFKAKIIKVNRHYEFR